MSAFAGLVAFDGAPVDAQEEAIQAITNHHRGRVLTHSVGGGLFAQQAASGPEAAPLSLTIREGRGLFAAVARLDNREELGAALGLASAALARTSDSQLIFNVLERWGEIGVARCVGAFAFALWDSFEGRLTLGRDCLGHRSLFYHHGKNFVAFATSLRVLLALPRVPRAIDDVALANFLAVNNYEPRRTFYRGIERVPSRTLVTIERGEARHQPYWAPDLAAPKPFRRDEEYIERARELFDRAVAAAVRDTPDVAIATSGGLDSSAVAATAARLGSARSITCFTLVPPDGIQIDTGPFRYLDERGKVEALVRAHPKLAARFLAPERNHALAEDDSRIFTRLCLPVNGAAVLGVSAHLNDAIRDAGHRTMLVGNAGNFGLSWDGSLSLIALLRGGAWRTFAQELRATAREGKRGLVHTLAGDVFVPAAPAWVRRLIYRARGRDPYSVARYSALNPDFVAEFGLPRQWRDVGFDPWFGLGGWNSARVRAHWMFDHRQNARDTRALWSEAEDLDVRDPHADRRLLEFLLKVPEPMFRRNGVPRSFARRVLADRLPPEILDERRRGSNAPGWFRLFEVRRQAIARDIERIEASPLASRLIDVPRLKRLIAQWPRDEKAAEPHRDEYRLALARGVHVGRFVRWVEGRND